MSAVGKGAHVKCLPELKWRCHCRTVAPTRIGIPPARFDLSYFSVLLLEICFVRSTLGDCEVTRTSMMWRRHLLNMARYYLKLHCCCHWDELKLLMFLLVMGQFLKSKGPECLWDIFENSWHLTLQKESQARSWTPFVFISVTITPIHNLASHNHIQIRLLCNFSFTNSSFFRPSTPLFFNPYTSRDLFAVLLQINRTFAIIPSSSRQLGAAPSLQLGLPATGSPSLCYS